LKTAHYRNATRRFAAWCEARGITELAAVEPSHVAAFIKQLQSQFTPPTVKQHWRRYACCSTGW
jgi:site-specific recombinase XerD